MNRLVYAFTLLLATHTSATPQSLEYSSVAQAREALLAKEGATVENKGDWLVITEPNKVSWTFTTSGHEAHPAFAKRTLLEKDGRFAIRTEISCESAKPACDRLHETFKALDARMNEAIAKQLDSGTKKQDQ